MKIIGTFNKEKGFIGTVWMSKLKNPTISFPHFWAAAPLQIKFPTWQLLQGRQHSAAFGHRELE